MKNEFAGRVHVDIGIHGNQQIVCTIDDDGIRLE